VKSYGYSGDYNILVMQLLGKSLEHMFTFCNKKFSVRCVCNLGYQMVEILKYIHDKHIIHQDIKPDNFVTSYGENKNNIYLLDFGLARKYRSSTTLKHYPKLEKKKLTGTARYASINALNGTTQSRRDDLESVGYVLMYFLRGNLPWQGLVVKNKNDKYSAIKEKKILTTANELCKGFPKEFEEYVNYTRNLDYEDEPDYTYLKNLFLNVLKSIGYKFDYYCDWSEDVNFNKHESNHTINYHNNYNNNYTINNNNSINNNENSNLGSKRNSRYVIIPEKHTNENIINSMFKNQEKQNKGNYYENIYNNNKNLANLRRKRSSIEFKLPNEQNHNQNDIKYNENEENNLNKNNNDEKQNNQNNNKNNNDNNNKNNDNCKYVNDNKKQKKDNNCCLIF